MSATRRGLTGASNKELLRAKSDCASNSGDSESLPNAGLATAHFRGVSSQRLLALFNDKHDDLDAYLTRFERVADARRWVRKQWATAKYVRT